jgi:hypothetical protein
VALGILALFAAMLLYLGMRPAGRAPMLVYVYGPLAVSLAALAVLVWGVVHGLRHRPFVRPARVRALAALTLVVGVASYPIPFPSTHEGHPGRAALRLPVEGEWTVLWGGDSPATNRLALHYPDRRYGLDLVVTDAEGRTRRGETEGPEDYLAWDRPVLAPAAGTVVAVHEGEPDHAPGARGEGEPLGNYLVIEVAPGEYAFLSHLRQGSIGVAVGDEVASGQPVGRVGSSGWSPLSPQPHVALHLQDDPAPRGGQPIPMRFHDYVADGRPVELGTPTGGMGPGGVLLGQRVRPSDPREDGPGPR